MWKWLTNLYLEWRMPASFRAFERAKRAEHEELARQKFSTLRLEARLLAANKAMEERVKRRFDMAEAKLQLEVVTLEKQLEACRAQLAGFQRPFRDEFQLLEAEMSLLGDRRRQAYAAKDAQEIEAVNADIAELQRRINAVRGDMGVQAGLREQGLTPEKMRRNAQRCEARLAAIEDEQAKLNWERKQYLNHSPDRAEIDQIEREIADMERKHAIFLRDFDAPMERRRREREHQDIYLRRV